MKLSQLCSRPKVVCAKQHQNMWQACAGVLLPQKIPAKPRLSSEFGFGKGCRSSRRLQLAHIVSQYLTLFYILTASCIIFLVFLKKHFYICTLFQIILHFYIFSIIHFYTLSFYFYNIIFFTVFLCCFFTYLLFCILTFLHFTCFTCFAFSHLF